MEKIMATFDGVLAGVTKFSNNKYIKSISDAMMALIGIMIFGSFAVIFRAFPIPSVAEFFVTIGLDVFFGAINNLTIGAISIYLVFLIAKKFDGQI